MQETRPKFTQKYNLCFLKYGRQRIEIKLKYCLKDDWSLGVHAASATNCAAGATSVLAFVAFAFTNVARNKRGTILFHEVYFNLIS
jgi:accessory gene regulator protein AgrB